MMAESEKSVAKAQVSNYLSNKHNFGHTEAGLRES